MRWFTVPRGELFMLIMEYCPGGPLFGVLKGAVDGGLHVPHSTKRFPGYKAGDEKGQGEYDAEFHKERIFGGHVSEYMESMKDEDEQQ